VINSKLGRIYHRLRDTATYSFKHFFPYCGQTAADGHIVTIDSHYRLICWYHRRSSTTYRSPTIPHDRFTTVHYCLSRSSKVNDLYLIWKPVCYFLL